MNRVTANAQICFLFIAPGALAMPTRCCTLRVSPLVRELILSLAERGIAKLAEPKTRRLVQVLFDELPQQPAEHLHLPVSGHPKIQIIVAGMAHEPENRRTLAQWAARLAMSERSLSRLIIRETGLNFRQWRHQLLLILALRRLIEGRAVQQVAQELGYDSTTAFITMFKNGLGVTPGRYLEALTSEISFCHIAASPGN